MSTRTSVLVVAVAVAVVAAMAPRVGAASKLPSNWKRCRADDPKLSDCLRAAVDDAIHKMYQNGLSALGVPPMDPLRVNEIKINQGQGPVNLNMELYNVSITGLGGSRVTNYSAALEDGILQTESMTPALKLHFNHEVNGRVLLLPIRGAGPGTITMVDTTTYHYLKFEPKKKDGRVYWNLLKYNVKFHPKSLSVDLKGLFGGDGRLSDQLSTFLNQNSRLLFDEIGGAFEEAFGAVFKEITGRLFSKVALDDIFTPKK